MKKYQINRVYLVFDVKMEDVTSNATFGADRCGAHDPLESIYTKFVLKELTCIYTALLELDS